MPELSPPSARWVSDVFPSDSTFFSSSDTFSVVPSDASGCTSPAMVGDYSTDTSTIASPMSLLAPLTTDTIPSRTPLTQEHLIELVEGLRVTRDRLDQLESRFTSPLSSSTQVGHQKRRMVPAPPGDGGGWWNAVPKVVTRYSQKAQDAVGGWLQRYWYNDDERANLVVFSNT